MDIKTLRAVFTGGSYCKTRPLTRQDYGIVLQFVHPDLPDTYQVHFSNSKENTGTAKTQIATADGVTIPDEYLIPGKSVYAWAFLQADGTGRTIKMVEIPVSAKPTVTDAPPTPQQRSAIDEAIEALNDGAERAEGAAGKAEEATRHYPRIVDGYWQVWDAEEQEWVDTDVKAVGEDGLPGRDGADGQDGAPGVTYTPTVSADGEISWTNDGGLPNPQPRNIMGPQGEQGIQGPKGDKGDKGEKGDTGEVTQEEFDALVSDVEAIKTELDGVATEATAQQTLGIEDDGAFWLGRVLMVMDGLADDLIAMVEDEIAKLPQDENGQAIAASIGKGNSWLNMLYHELEV